MAQVDFFRLIVSEDNKEITLKLEDVIRTQLDKMTHDEKYCKNRVCDATMAEYIANEDSITFDFIKFTQEIIYSTIISEPAKDTDTFQALNNHEIKSVKYTQKDCDKVKNIIQRKNVSIYDIKVILEKSHINNFAIYKIIDDENIDISDDDTSLSKLFYDSNLERLKKVKTFFNLLYYKNHNILMLQKVSDGFDYKKLEEYLNLYILIGTEYNVRIEVIYDNGFLDILEHAELTEFKFEFNLQEKSNLDNKNFNSTFHQIFDYMGKSKTTISTKADKNTSLNNEILVKFYNSAIESGLMETAKIKRKGQRRPIDSQSKGENLFFSNPKRIKTLDEANQNFKEAFETYEETIGEKIWIQ